VATPAVPPAGAATSADARGRTYVDLDDRAAFDEYLVARGATSLTVSTGEIRRIAAADRDRDRDRVETT